MHFYNKAKEVHKSVLKKQRIWAKGWHGKYTAIANGWKLDPSVGYFSKQKDEMCLAFTYDLKVIDVFDCNRFIGYYKGWNNESDS